MLTPDVLIRTDAAGEHSTVALADILTGYGSWEGVVLSGCTVALLAVTSVAFGFSESLAERLARLHRVRGSGGTTFDISDAANPRRILRMQLAVLGVGAVLSMPLQTANRSPQTHVRHIRLRRHLVESG